MGTGSLIKNLHIKNFILVEELSVNFSSGLTALTGETGSGKSIIITALSLVLGEKTEKKMIRVGETRATITASFSLKKNTEAAVLLRELALDEDEVCILRRVISKNGRSAAFCNAISITIATMQKLGAALMDIHAQHGNTRILDPLYQRGLLDSYGKLENAQRKVKDLYHFWKTTQDALEDLQKQVVDDGKIQLVQYQTEELENARLTPYELENIENEYKLLANSGLVEQNCAEIISILEDDSSELQSLLKGAASRADILVKTLPAAKNLRTLLEQADISLGEALQEAETIAKSINCDPEKLNHLDNRLTELHNLARKHHVPMTELSDKYNSLLDELKHLTSIDGQLAETEENAKNLLKKFLISAEKLSYARQKSAKELNTSISASMRQLDMPHGLFQVKISKYKTDIPRPNGLEQIAFNVTTNPDQPLDNMSKVASGGELSRISLAIQATTAKHMSIPAIVYDEVDSGIGGNTAHTVGQNLLEISNYCQIICITHSPQVAGICDHQILVTKEVLGKRTLTQARILSAKERETEISRMLGAKSTTDSSLAHAKDLLKENRSH